MADYTWPDAYLSEVRVALQHHAEAVEPGLSEEECAAVESRFGFRFPPDLRALLQTMLPRGERFPDWRLRDLTGLHRRLDWPGEGACFDVRFSNVWLARWGPRPVRDDEACAIARLHLARAPYLIPVFAHRYLPASPAEAGNPVFSVYQTDIIIYGTDLADYFHREFGVPRPAWSAMEPRPIEFWDLFAFGLVREDGSERPLSERRWDPT